MTKDIPRKCRQCVFYNKQTVFEECTVCVELSFREAVLCDLNNKTVDKNDIFVCHRFRPDLKIVGSENGPGQFVLPVARNRKDYFKEILKIINSLGRCGNGSCGCRKNEKMKKEETRKRYHVVWNTVGRKAIFARPDRYISFFHDAFLTCGALINGNACFIWLAPDHLHFYLELGADELVMDIAEDIQLLIQDALLEEFKQLRSRDSGIVWNNNFFIENIE